MKKILAFCFFFNFISFFAQNNVSKIDSLEQLISISKKRDTSHIKNLMLLSKLNVNKNIDKKIELLITANKTADSLKNTKFLAKTYIDLSRAYLTKGVNDTALNYALKAKEIYKKEGLKNDKLLINSQLSRFYRAQGYKNEALKINKESLALVKNDPITPALGRYYFDVALTYHALDSFVKAEKHYLKALEISEKTNFETGKNLIYLNLGSLNKKLEKFKIATNYLKKSLLFYEKIENKEKIGQINHHFGNILSIQAKHLESIPFYEKSLKIYKELGHLPVVKRNYQALFIAYNVAGDIKKAQEANKQYVKYEKILEDKERKQLIAKMKTQFETDKIKAENELNKKKVALAEAKNQRNIILLITSLAIILLLALLIWFNNNRLQQSKKNALIQQQLEASKKQLALEKQYQHSELRSLKAQMNPHFMFNAMNSIQNLVLKGDKQNAYNYLTKLAQLIRENLNLSEKSFVYFDEELSLLQKYLELEKLRFKDDFNYKINGISEIGDVKIPSMIIQPFVENAIKHGLLHKTNGLKQVTIDFYQEKTVFKCVVTDNGIGIEASKKINEQNHRKQDSFSTNAIQERLQLLREYYTLDIGYEYIPISEGTQVVLKIPYLKDDE